jgi:hypothetical protein
MAGNQVAYGASTFEAGLSAVSLRPSWPLALIPVNGEKKNEMESPFLFWCLLGGHNQKKIISQVEPTAI